MLLSGSSEYEDNNFPFSKKSPFKSLHRWIVCRWLFCAFLMKNFQWKLNLKAFCASSRSNANVEHFFFSLLISISRQLRQFSSLDWSESLSEKLSESHFFLSISSKAFWLLRQKMATKSFKHDQLIKHILLPFNILRHILTTKSSPSSIFGSFHAFQAS